MNEENRHRQNALLTYRALVAAAGEHETEDIVLAMLQYVFLPHKKRATLVVNPKESENQSHWTKLSAFPLIKSTYQTGIFKFVKLTKTI